MIVAHAVIGRRVGAAVVLLVVIAAGLLVHLALPDTAATDIAGDALYPLAVYAAVVLLAPRAASIAVGAVTLVWCVAIELWQLTGVPSAVAAAFPPAVLLLGTVFDPRDLLVSAITAPVVTAVDLCIRRITPSVRRSLPPRSTEGVNRAREE